MRSVKNLHAFNNSHKRREFMIVELNETIEKLYPGNV